MIQWSILRLFRFIGLDIAFTTLFQNLFKLTPLLVRQVGIIPTAMGIWNIRKWIGMNYSFKTLTAPLLNNIHPIILRDFMTMIFPHIDICMLKNAHLLRNLMRLYSSLFIFGLIRPIMTLIFKYSFGIIFSSLGIALNEALSAITVLKYISDYVLSIFPVIPFFNNFMSQFSDVVTNRSSVKTRLNTPEVITETSSVLSIFGLILIGAGSLFIVILVGDYFLPSITRSIPGVETILNGWYGVYDYMMSWIYPSTSDLPSRSPSPDINLSDSIARTSSSGSDSTILPPTPRPSRPSTPEWFPPYIPGGSQSGTPEYHNPFE